MTRSNCGEIYHEAEIYDEIEDINTERSLTGSNFVAERRPKTQKPTAEAYAERNLSEIVWFVRLLLRNTKKRKKNIV